MEPFEVIGATAALAQLIQLCIKSGNQAHRLVQSYIKAPKELAQLSKKLDHLRLLLQHIQDLYKDLADAQAEYLLPDAHKDLIYGCLQVNVVALENLQALQNAQNPTTNSSNVKNSLRWAAVDKRKSHAIIEELKGSETSLDVILSLLSVRIASLNRASIVALRLSQESFYSQMANSVEEIKLCFRAQTGLISSEETSASTRHVIEKFQDEQRADSIETKHWLSSIMQSQSQNQIISNKCSQSHKETLSELSSLRRDIESHRSKSKCITPLPEMQTPHRKRTTKIPRQPLNPICPPTRLRKHETGPDFERRMQERKFEHDWKKMITKHSYISGFNDEVQPPRSFKPRLAVSMRLMATKNSWKAHAALRARLYVLGQRLVFFEIKARHFARAWMSVPFLGCSMTILHVRSSEDPIFLACRDWDLSTVRYLIETRQASVHDIDHDKRANLLQVNLLRSIGFSDWNPLGGSSDLLVGAIHANDLEELLFGLEIVKMDPTMQVTGGRALDAAVSFNNVRFAGILTAAGAPLRWNSSEDFYICPLVRGLRENSSYEMGHWLLFAGADTRQFDFYSGTAWYSFWQGAAIRYGNVPIHFIQMEGILSHLLLHGSNPHDIFIRSNVPSTFASANFGKPWYHWFGQIKATEVARLPAYKSSVLREWTEYGHGFPSNDWKEAYEKNEAQRRPEFLASWTSSGVISWSDTGLDDERESDKSNFDNGLSRFPFVRLLVNALQLAGYRAEMDDDGDVWYDDEDGDQYVDAREFQPSEDADDGFVANCPICQNPEKYGLGYVVTEGERGKQILREYREKRENKKKEFF
ncbi:hypothetical protein BKA56DRAFT_554399 [Ilyonectria sp. MPI-CAGE-AT-0026]|nr:hypothetical protein BKA56DRAFT_554399 [Ilyonectria sp. MPI-CAGE-AT-0026]